jgi:hypothetical protein
MNQQEPKKTKKQKTKSKIQARDLKPKNDAKGGDGPTGSISFNFGGIKY